MTEAEVLKLVKDDEWMMKMLRKAEEQNLPDWVIGAGFIRNKVWDHLHNIKRERVATNDIDLVYFNPAGNNEAQDLKLSRKLENETGFKWEVVNEAYAHKFNNLEPFSSTKDALAHWVETATAVGVNLDQGELKLMCPYGIDDLVNLVLRPSPNLTGASVKLQHRAHDKGWLKKWPKLKIVEN